MAGTPERRESSGLTEILAELDEITVDNFRSEARTWLRRQDAENLRSKEEYFRDLTLMCGLVNSPPFETMKQTLKDALLASQGNYFAGRNFCYNPTFSNERVVALHKVSPHFCHPNILSLLQSKEYGGLPGAILSKLELLEKAGLNPNRSEFALLMALTAITAGREEQFTNIVEWIRTRTKMEKNAPKSSVPNPHQFFLNILKNPEFWRGFVDAGLEEVNQYLSENFGTEAQKAKQLWSMIWFAKLGELKSELTSQVPLLIREAARLLLHRKWDKARGIIKKIAGETPDLFSRFDLEELKVTQRKQTRLLVGCLVEYLGEFQITGRTEEGKQVFIKATDTGISGEKRGGRAVKLLQESTEGRLPFSKNIGGKWYHVATLTPETLLQSLESGKYKVPEWPEIKDQLMAQLLGQSD